MAHNQHVMYTAKTNLRVRYAETDQMGIVYYGIYPQYFEVGRVEALRELGITYREIEERGTMLPVAKLDVKYIKSAKYDDLLTIVTQIKELPSTRLHFDHEVYNQANELLTVGSVTLVFVKADTMRPTKAPEYVLNLFKPYFLKN